VAVAVVPVPQVLQGLLVELAVRVAILILLGLLPLQQALVVIMLAEVVVVLKAQVPPLVVLVAVARERRPMEHQQPMELQILVVAVAERVAVTPALAALAVLVL